jgi:type VI secretion system protein ImpF
MAIEPPVTLSVLDRLTEKEESEPRISEALASRSESRRYVRWAVRRDLEWLLNTRQVREPPAESLRELNRSLYVFGIPDFTSWSLGSSKTRQELLKSIQNVLKIFEPRLSSVRVVPLEESSSGSRTLPFRIEAVLLMNPGREQIAFDSSLQLTTGRFTVKGGTDAG